MKQIAIGSGIAVPTFTLTGTENNYWLERLCYEEVLKISRAYTEGVSINVPEETDISSAETSTESLSAYLKSWFDSAVVSSSGGDIPAAIDKSYIPDIASFVGLALTGQWGLIFVLFVKVGLEFLLDSTEKKLDPKTESGDVAEILKSVLGVLDEDGNLIGSRVDSLRDLAITINNYDETQDNLWSSDS